MVVVGGGAVSCERGTPVQAEARHPRQDRTQLRAPKVYSLLPKGLFPPPAFLFVYRSGVGFPTLNPQPSTLNSQALKRVRLEVWGVGVLQRSTPTPLTHQP